MAVAGKVGRVSDPVYGFIGITDIERTILDQRIAQRLRYISQAGLAHLVFPEVRTSRFSHSLGAMHLASRFLTACLMNADPATRDIVCDAIKRSVRATLGAFPGPYEVGEGLAEHILEAHTHCQTDAGRYVLFAEQAVRLAALFHDIGHLPFSHDFEVAIEDYSASFHDASGKATIRPLVVQQAGRTKLHERLGYNVASLLLQELSADPGIAEAHPGLNHIFRYAFAILTAVPTPDPASNQAAIQWLHSLLSGDLDVDRCDYLLRDGRNYGFEFAPYNLPRLLDNLVVASDGRTFTTCVRPQGVGALESYLLSRFRSYQYGVRHHKVAQVGVALQFCMFRLLQDVSNHSVQQFIADLSELASIDASAGIDPAIRRKLLNSFANYDDNWWMLVMRAALVAQPDDPWLGLVCWRTRAVRSLWKRLTDFGALLIELEASGKDSGVLTHGAVEDPLVAIWNWALPNQNDADALKPWEEVRNALRKDGTLLVRHYFSPFEVDAKTGKSHLNVCAGDGRLIPVSELSPLIRALGNAWMGDVQVHAFAAAGSSSTPIVVLEQLAAVMGEGA
jgi:HD superfamily phosphohydrolase